MEMPTNPLAVLTFISAPAVLTNASCVLLFGTGNRYGRAVDRLHELAEMVEKAVTGNSAERALRVRQLEAGETRALLIVRALTCFYSAVAGFVLATLISLVGALLQSAGAGGIVNAAFVVAFVCGTCGVFAMVTGAVLLARETRHSFRILSEETRYLQQTVRALP